MSLSQRWPLFQLVAAVVYLRPRASSTGTSRTRNIVIAGTFHQAHRLRLAAYLERGQALSTPSMGRSKMCAQVHGEPVGVPAGNLCSHLPRVAEGSGFRLCLL